jgi:hypothetical protein
MWEEHSATNENVVELTEAQMKQTSIVKNRLLNAIWVTRFQIMG